jgi:predicted flavoprotein YhiN
LRDDWSKKNSPKNFSKTSLKKFFKKYVSFLLKTAQIPQKKHSNVSINKKRYLAHH